MAYFTLTDLTTTLNLDDEVSKLNLGGSKRGFSLIEFAGQNGAMIKGTGNFGAKTIKFSRREYAVNSDYHAWNSRRDTFIALMTKAANVPVYMVIQTATSTYWRTRVYCQEIASLLMNYIKVGDVDEFTLISPDGFFECQTKTTATTAITTGAEQTIAMTNSGNIGCPITCKFTPTGNETILQCLIYDNYGFRLEGTFSAGIEITYHTGTGAMTINGLTVNSKNYLTWGSVFEIPAGSSNIYVGASGPCSFIYDFYARKI
jgi:hypothetical protein